jgi:hypothetical protein
MKLLSQTVSQEPSIEVNSASRTGGSNANIRQVLLTDGQRNAVASAARLGRGGRGNGCRSSAFLADTLRDRGQPGRRRAEAVIVEAQTASRAAAAVLECA